MRIKYLRKLTILVISAIMVLASVVAVSAEPVTSTMSRTEMLDVFYPVGCYFETTDGSSAANTGASSAANTGGSSKANTDNPTESNGAAHNNMQPYKVVVRWHRDA